MTSLANNLWTLGNHQTCNVTNIDHYIHNGDTKCSTDLMVETSTTKLSGYVESFLPRRLTILQHIHKALRLNVMFSKDKINKPILV
ncbi:CLUMA_CG016975, isoform A [Clunio marinus]|uniref:CLUMA_CG016975, isoform A n=1 Tax=Clunio marinus TaxID=568069 RepID=A0A1J1IUK3_9DIPT|nr:CLUMA_CG016975, isoform A [Clunio marinus]